jgi:site-specific recombinase XerC
MRVEFKMKYIQHWTDDLGRERYRFRRRGYPRVELPVNGDPHSVEFAAAYFAALRGEKPEHALAMVAARGGSGSVKDAVEQYLSSTTFHDYSRSTQDLRRPILKGFLKPGVGNLPLAQMDRKYIERWLETASTKGTKRTWLLAIKPFMAWAVEAVHLIETNATDGIKVKSKVSEGHPGWTDQQVEQFRSHHPIGSKARLALELSLALATRRGDAISLGRQHLKEVRVDPSRTELWLVYTQEKNRKRKPVKVETPLPAPLLTAIEACPSAPESLTFITSESGRPFSKKGFNTWFRKQIAAAGLPDTCVPHGLRKSSCKTMAESDCTAHEIMSVSGHRTLKEVGHYTQGVNNRRLAARAQAKVAAAGNVVPLAVVAGR